MSNFDETVDWSSLTFKKFKVAYVEAERDKAEWFVFENREFVTDYAKYLIEYLSDKFNHD